MSKNRTVNQLLDLLTKKEKNQFLCFLKSEVSQKQLKICVLYECLVKDYPIAKIWSELFPETSQPEDPFSTSVYRKLEFQLSHYLEEFLAIQTFLNDHLTKDLFMIKALNNRKAGKLFETKLKKTRARLSKSPVRDETYYWLNHQLERENQHFLHKRLLKSKISIAPSLSESFDIWWLHEKFKMAINNLNHQLITGMSVPNLFIEEASRYFSTLPPEKLPVLCVYVAIYKTLAGEEKELDLKNLIYDQKELMGPDALKDTFTTILNYYGRMVNTTGSKEYLKKLFELYLWGLEDRLIFKDNVLSGDHYKNFITIALGLKEFKLALNFIEEYKSYIPVDHREEAYRFSLARYYFTQGEFKRVIRLLNLKFSNVYYEIQARFLVLQAHYELGSDADLTRSLRSLRIFISRQKLISEPKKEIEIMRVKLFEKLVKAYSKQDYNKLSLQISNNKMIGNPQWLIEKVNEGKSSVRI